MRGDEPAFPVLKWNGSQRQHLPEGGMTIRQLVAAIICCGVAVKSGDAAMCAEWALEITDSLLAAEAEGRE